MLGGLQRNAHTAHRAQLAGPHACGVHHVLALDGAVVGDDTLHGAVLHHDVGDRHALRDGDALHARALGHAHRHIDRVHSPVARHVETGQQVVGACEGEHVGHFAGRQFVHVHAHVAVERADAAVLLEAAFVGGEFDEADRLEAGGQTRFSFEVRVEVAGVLAQFGGGLRGAAERDHQACGMPRRAGGELIAFHQHRVGPAHVTEVVGDGGADDATTDDDDAGSAGQALAHGAPIEACTLRA